MRGIVLAVGLASVSPLAFAVPLSGFPQAPPVPYKERSREPLEFRGPGRDDADPGVDAVLVGWFGPGDPDHPDFGELWRGACLALTSENSAGGYRGKPFRLQPVWSDNPWQAGITGLTRLVHEAGVWAVIGGVDGSTTHLALQTALKSDFLLLSPASTDATTDHANVPWLFSLAPSDEAQAPLLAAELARAALAGRFAIAAATDHDSHATLVELRRALGARTPARVLEFAPRAMDLEGLAGRLAVGRPEAIVVLAQASVSGRLVAALRGAGFDGTILGGVTLATNAFRRAAGGASEGVRAPLAIQPGAAWDAFEIAYTRRWGERPDLAAAQGYDALRLVAAAVRRAGLNRARIRDELRALAPWSGAAGVVRWDVLGRNSRAVAVGAWRLGLFRSSVAAASAPRRARP